MHRSNRRRAVRGLALCSVAAVILAGCSDGDSDEVSAPETMRILAGVNDQEDPTIAITEFLPGSVSIATGATVEWQFSGPEPHSVTFASPDEELPGPGSAEFDELLSTPTDPVESYEGGSFVNTGLLPLGPEPVDPFSLSFPTEGEYSYICLIHPLMTGTITVVGDDAEADTQAAVNERANDELGSWLEEGRAAKQALATAPPARTENPDGTTTWTYEMGTTTEHTDVLAFAPDAGEVQPGDSVTFVNNTLAPHTATFPSGSEVPPNPLDPAVNAPTGPSPFALLSTDGPYNSGLVPPAAPPNDPPPVEVRTYTFVIAEAGSYPYVCVYHAASGMAGTITVA